MMRRQTPKAALCAAFVSEQRGGTMENETVGQPETGRRRLSRRNAAALAVIFLFLLVYGLLAAELYREAARERRDIDALECAAAAGKTAYENGADLNTRFWFNRSDNTLYDAGARPPEPYGCGTTVNGKIIMMGEASRRGYDLEKDYRRYVLLVRAVPVTADDRTENASVGVDFSVKTEWVYIPAE